MWRLAALLILARAVHSQSIEGTVTNVVTHAPIAGVYIRLKGPATYTSSSDAAGVFRVAEAAPGEYFVDILVTGYYPVARKTVEVGATPVHVAYELTPLAKLQGRVLYSDGTPAAGAQVVLVMLPARQALGIKTDERGRFTSNGILGERFILCAQGAASAKAVEGEEWAPTCYPNTLDRSAAEVIQLKPGGDVSGYDIRLRSVPVYRISGIVLDDLGKPAAGAKIQLMSNNGLPALRDGIPAAADGSFTIPSAHAGEWLLFARLKRGDLDLKTIRIVTVKRSDLEDVSIHLDRPFALAGFVERDEPRDANGRRALTSVYLQGEPPIEGLSVHATHDQDGAILFKNIYPGRYRIVPLGIRSGFYVESVKLGDRDVLGEAVDLVEGGPPLRVIYRSGAPRVRVHVEKGAGACVAIVPQNEALVNEQFIREATADKDGRSEIGSLRPGDYYAFAFDRLDMGSLQDPAFLRTLIPSAVKVHVEKGEAATVDLKVTPWPQ
jgi:hypothetical protein